MKSILAALLALLFFPALASAETPTGGFSSDAPVAEAPVGKAAIASDRRTAVAPQGAPEEVVKAIAAANKITRKPYKWGGGHGRWWDSGYDCSGSVSYVLHAAGLLSSPLDSSAFMSWGAPGPGKHITIYANSGHVFMTIDGRRFDTGYGGNGNRWASGSRPTSGFVVRHPPGY